MDYETCNIVYKDFEGWECIETCIVGSRRFWHLLAIGGEVIPGYEQAQRLRIGAAFPLYPSSQSRPKKKAIFRRDYRLQ